MAATHTTLAAAAGANDTSFKVTAATGATAGAFIKVDNEVAIIASIVGTVIHVKRRGCEGTACVAHNSLAPVAFFAASDLAASAPGQLGGLSPANSGRFAIVGYGADGAIAVPTQNTIALFTSTTATALTLADPPVSSDGVMLIVAQAAAAGGSGTHTLTLATGVLGSNASDVFTFVTATAGAGVTLVAYKGRWAQIATGLLADESVAAAVA